MGGVLFLAGAVCFWFSCHVPWLVLSASMAGALVFFSRISAALRSAATSHLVAVVLVVAGLTNLQEEVSNNSLLQMRSAFSDPC